MSTHPGTAAESADSDKCICCKRSKSGGSFFEVRPSYYCGNTGVATCFYLFPDWDADIDVFHEASRQGCQRCAVAYDMVTTWMEHNPGGDWCHVSIQNQSASYSMVADVRVYLETSRKYYLYGGESITLELLSANRRCPKQKSCTLCGHPKSNKLKTEIQLAIWRILGTDGTLSRSHCHMKTPRLMMIYRRVSNA